mmetsp:Transcript_61/g.110  ORF Transcript_61/g.110 Transcript_61/m.110 type:complete len:254 (-) Transcript_61:2089-2850(-)
MPMPQHSHCMVAVAHDAGTPAGSHYIMPPSIDCSNRSGFCSLKYRNRFFSPLRSSLSLSLNDFRKPQSSCSDTKSCSPAPLMHNVYMLTKVSWLARKKSCLVCPASFAQKPSLKTATAWGCCSGSSSATNKYFFRLSYTCSQSWPRPSPSRSFRLMKEYKTSRWFFSNRSSGEIATCSREAASGDIAAGGAPPSLSTSAGPLPDPFTTSQNAFASASGDAVELVEPPCWLAAPPPGLALGDELLPPEMNSGCS